MGKRNRNRRNKNRSSQQQEEATSNPKQKKHKKNHHLPTESPPKQEELKVNKKNLGAPVSPEEEEVKASTKKFPKPTKEVDDLKSLLGSTYQVIWYKSSRECGNDWDNHDISRPASGTFTVSAKKWGDETGTKVDAVVGTFKIDADDEDDEDEEGLSGSFVENVGNYDFPANGICRDGPDRILMARDNECPGHASLGRFIQEGGPYDDILEEHEDDLNFIMVRATLTVFEERVALEEMMKKKNPFFFEPGDLMLTFCEACEPEFDKTVVFRKTNET